MASTTASYKIGFSPDMDNFKGTGAKAAKDFTSGFKTNISGAADISESVNSAGLTDKLKSVGSVAGKIGGVAAKGFGLAATAIGGLAATAISSTASIEQSLGGAEAVFEKNAGEIKKWAGSAAGAMGITNNEALEVANKMGSLFQGAGHSVAKSAEMTMGYSQRAADVASIMGVDLSSAMEAVTGAAKGNFEMMDNLGVAMNATTLEAYALSKGIKEPWKDMSNAQKTGIAYQMFMEKTAKYAGNFEKENTTLAGSFDILKSSWGNVMQSVSSPEMLDGAISQLTKAVTGMVEALKKTLPSIIKGIGTLLKDGIPILLDTILELLPEIVKLIQDALPVLLEGIIQALPGLIEGLIAAIIALLPILLEGIIYLITTLIPMLPKIIGMLIPAVIEAVGILIVAIIDLFKKLPSMISEYFNNVLTVLTEFFPNAAESIMTFGPMIGDAVKAIVDAVVGFFSFMFNGIKDLFLGYFKFVIDFWVNLGTAIYNGVSTISTKGTELFRGMIEKIINFFTDLPNKIKEAIQGIANIGADIVNGIWEGIKSKANWLGDNIANFGQDVMDSFTNFFGIHSPSRLTRDIVGKNVALGVGEGILSSTKAAENDAKKFSSAVSQAVDINANNADLTSNLDISGNVNSAKANSGVTVNQYLPAPTSMKDVYVNSRRGTVAGFNAKKK